MQMTIKRFEELTTTELYELLRSRAEVFVVEQDCVYQDLDGADRHATHLFFEDAGRICSYIRVIDPGVKYAAASIGRVITLPDYRRRGLSTQLIRKGIELALALSPVIEIEAQSYLREFYGSFGFRVVSEEFLLDGLPHFQMRLEQPRCALEK